jgi:hypothetical protein
MLCRGTNLAAISLQMIQELPLQSKYFINRCLRETLTGFQAGLTEFSGPSRAAIIFIINKDEPLYIYYPQNLLRGYEPKLQAIFLDNTEWCKPFTAWAGTSYNHIEPQNNLQLDGLICQGGSSSPVFYQMWFTEHHPNLCSIKPTECWLEHAILRFSHDMANDIDMYTGISGNFLKE